jgi:hypothetical protein
MVWDQSFLCASIALAGLFNRLDYLYVSMACTGPNQEFYSVSFRNFKFVRQVLPTKTSAYIMAMAD